MRTLWVCWVVLAAALASCEPLPGPAGLPTAPASPVEEASPTADVQAARRLIMVRSQIGSRDVSDPAVLKAMEAVPRHLFVPPEYLDQAYEDHPLPIGYGQTISQPYIVGLMTQYLKLKPGDKVLEIGTGSGYQAAILAQLGVEAYSVEIVPELAAAAGQRLKSLGYNVSAKQGDGYFGWEEHAPFDAIIVTAAPDHVPQPLVKQLKDGGRLVIPVGPHGFQVLWQFTRQGEELSAAKLADVMFVPLVRGK